MDLPILLDYNAPALLTLSARSSLTRSSTSVVKLAEVNVFLSIVEASCYTISA